MKQARGGRGDRRSLMRRADARQGGNGAGALFARLDALRHDDARHDDARPSTAAADVLARWAERVRAGMWSDEIAALIAQAEALERQLEPRQA
jgi:hypothetical protein